MRSDAEKFYHGVEGYNCAQAVVAAAALDEKHGVDNALLAHYRAFGGGRAEGNRCGALVAAFDLAERAGRGAEVVAHFEREVGSLRCKEIRSAGAVPCRSCVGIAADALTCVSVR